MRDIEEAIKTLRRVVRKKKPETFSSTWIQRNAPSMYRYMRHCVRIRKGRLDWNRITSTFNQSFSRRWTWYGCRNIRIYEKQSEVDTLLERYHSHLHFLLSAKKADRKIQNKIIVSFVRLSQKGNITAQDELIRWITFITDGWIDKYPQLYRWQAYQNEIPDKIFRCIRAYRYLGPFLGYLFKTLELAGRGKPPLVSLDDKFIDGEKTRIDFVVMEEENEEDSYY